MGNRFATGLVMAAFLFGVCGCSSIEPRHGTRVVLSVADGRTPSREEVGEVCRQLIDRAEFLLRAKRARIEKVVDSRFVLLLPDRELSRRDAPELLATPDLDFCHLTNVATRSNPDRPWKIKAPSSADRCYSFVNSAGQALRVGADDSEIMNRVVGAPAIRPLLTENDIIPAAYTTRFRKNHFVWVRFTDDGARRFWEFARANPGEYLAVFLNGSLLCAPPLELPKEEGSAEVAISGLPSEDSATLLARSINLGKLRVPLKLVSVERY